MSEPFLAEIRIFSGNFAPRGWAFCDGQLLPIAQNTALFSLLGTTYGGDGRTTVALPDLRGRAAMHPGRGPGLTVRTLGQRTGVEAVTLSEAQIPNHAHVVQSTGDDNNASSPIGAVPGLSEEPQYRPQATITTGQQLAADALTPVGGNQPHNNMQPFIVVNFIIALVGLYPSRS